MQKLIAAIAVASVLATSALAQDSAPLPAGRPSGVAKAQGILDNTPLLVVGGIVVLVAVVLATNSSTSTAAATTPASTTTS
jgi:hypothetical protein